MNNIEQQPNDIRQPDLHKASVSRRLQEAKQAAKERSEKRMKEIPEIHWEILSYANHHTKEQVIEKYPEHIEFINKIVGFDGRPNGG
jgi:L-lactate utilization protein LutB